MRRFRFRLQKVLEHREAVEEQAKQAFLTARAQTLEAEAAMEGLRELRFQAAARSIATVDDRLMLEAFIAMVKDREQDQKIVIQTLVDEEEAFRAAWIEARRDAEALRKLREKAHSAWVLDSERKEQADLDEWAVLRRAA